MTRHALQVATFVLCIASLAFADPQTIGKGKQPQIATAGDNVFVVFGLGNEILLARSNDAGKTFAAGSVVTSVNGMPLGMRRGPRLAATSDTLVVTAIESPQGGGKDGDIFAWSSVDEGKTWVKGARPLNSAVAAAREGLHDMAGDGKGKVAVVWLDMRRVGQPGAGTEVWIATSDDGGRTWGEDRPVYVNQGGTVCECCHPSVTYDHAGNPVIMFRNSLSGARDMFAVTSTDGGRTFSEARKLGEGTWKINACPMDGGDVITTGEGTVTTWRRETQIFLSEPGSAEQKLGQGMQPVLAAAPDGVYVLWQRGNDIVIRRPNGKPNLLAERASYPSIVTTREGNVVAAWQSGESVVASVVTAAP